MYLELRILRVEQEYTRVILWTDDIVCWKCHDNGDIMNDRKSTVEQAKFKAMINTGCDGLDLQTLYKLITPKYHVTGVREMERILSNLIRCPRIFSPALVPCSRNSKS